MRSHRVFPLLLAGLLAAASAGAYTLEQFRFEDPQRTEEFRSLLGELRCVVCQNETLAVSQADVAEIMREEVYRLAKEGKSDQEIKAHLVSRYGDFVLYNPPLKVSTLLVWFGPFVLVAAGGFFLARTLMRKGQTEEAELSAQEEARLKAILGDSPAEQESKK